MYYTIWIVMVILGVLQLVVTVILAYVFRVFDLLDELSGRKAKRQIRRLRELNVTTGSLENIESTADFYNTISTGSLIDVLSAGLPSSVNSSSSNVNLATTSKDEVTPDEESQSKVNSESEDATNFMGEDSEDATNFMGTEPEDATNFIEEGATGFMSVPRNTFGVVIVEEKSSVNFN